MRVDRPIHQRFPSPNSIPFMDIDVFTTWNEIFTLLAVISHHQYLASAFLEAPKFDHAVDLGNDCLLFRLTCLEQFGNSRQTARDVFGLGRFTWDLGDDIPGGHLVPIV